MIKRGTAEKRFRAVYQTHTRNNLPPLSSDSRNTNDSISFDFFFIYVGKRIPTHLLLNVESVAA